jgi:DNA-directed RNA polymerase specialized sigma24 family protein
VPIEEVIDSLPAEDRTAGISSRDIDTLLDQLKPSQREIVRSISLNGSSIQETAAHLKMS